MCAAQLENILAQSLSRSVLSHSDLGISSFRGFASSRDTIKAPRTIFNGTEKLPGTTPIKLSLVVCTREKKSRNSMITKVVLGVALILIEFSIIARSQNSSISSAHDASSTTPFPTSSFELTKEADEASTISAALLVAASSVAATSEVPQVVTNETTSSIKVGTALEFTTATVDGTTIETTSTTTEDFRLPENCSAYKVCFLLLPSFFPIIAKCRNFFRFD